MQLKFSLHFFENSSNVMFHENPWQNADNQKEGRTDSHDEAVSFSNSNKAPNIFTFWTGKIVLYVINLLVLQQRRSVFTAEYDLHVSTLLSV